MFIITESLFDYEVTTSEVTLHKTDSLETVQAFIKKKIGIPLMAVFTMI